MNKIKVFLLMLSLLFASSAYAQMSLSDPNEGPKVKAQLVAENDGIEAGTPFRVALRQEITPGWHTYWRNPGDTGLATTISWQLPQGFTVGDLQFPTPHKQPTGPLMNFGYSDSVMILAEITPPADIKVGDDIEIKGKANWLVCQEVCIPESASFLVTLPVVKKAVPGAWSSAFNAVAKQLPQAHTAQQSAKVDGDNLVISIDPLPMPATELPEEAFFFPHDGLLIQHAVEQKLELNGRRATLTIPRNKTRSEPVQNVTGDLWLRNATGDYNYQFVAAVETPPPVIPAQAGIHDATQQIPVAGEGGPSLAQGLRGEETQSGFLSILVAAFLGGLILNLMPCVFPVLSLKALGLVQKSHVDDRRSVIIGGLVYLAGVLATFILLGLILIAFKNAGHAVGWGAQLQSPRFVAAMALLLFVIGLSLTGLVTFGTRLMGLGSGLASKHGHAGSFFTGALAVVVATPCTAPFMGAAVFYALTHSAAITLIVMMAMGVGLAAPYVALTLAPGGLRFLPRPGIWMEYFKQFLAFPMIAASIWLVWVLAQQTGANGVLFVLFSMLFLSFGLWLFKTTQNAMNDWWQIVKKLLAAGAIVLSLIMIVAQPMRAGAVVTTTAQTTEYEAYTPARFDDLRAQNKAVFVNMTAAWCITCLANEKAALGTDAVRGFFKANNITYLKGDWTNYDDAITQFLKQFGRSGVPIYVFYPADKNRAALVLPQLLTPDTVISTIQPQLRVSK